MSLACKRQADVEMDRKQRSMTMAYDMGAQTSAGQAYSGATLGSVAPPKDRVTASGNIASSQELVNLMLEVLKEATSIADQLDGGGLNATAKDQQRPVPSGACENQAQLLRDCHALAREIRGQMQRIGGRV